MAIDLKKSFASVVTEKPLTAGATISTEGLVLVSTIQSGVETVAACSNATESGYVVVGFSMANNEQPTTRVVVETVTLSAASGDYCTATLAHPNLVVVSTDITVEARVFNAAGTALSAIDASTPASGEFNIDPVTGLLTCHHDIAKTTVTVQYRYTLSAVESTQLYWQPNVNNTAINVLGLVGVYQGKGQIFTMEYDAASNWAAAGTVYTWTNGKVSTKTTTGTSLATKVRVIKAPTVLDPSLGLEFNF